MPYSPFSNYLIYMYFLFGSAAYFDLNFIHIVSVCIASQLVAVGMNERSYSFDREDTKTYSKAQENRIDQIDCRRPIADWPASC